MSDPSTKQGGRSSRRWRGALLIFGLALLARAGFGLFGSGEGLAAPLRFDDEIGYWNIARSYAAGNGMVGEFGHRAGRMPLYPWFLSFFVESSRGVAWARGAQWVAGALAAPLAFLLCRRIAPFAWLAGLVVAFDPALVGSASLLLTETLFVTALAGLWLAAPPARRSSPTGPGRWVVVSVLAAVCVHVRESSLLFVAALCVFLAVRRRDRAALVGAGFVIAVVFVALLPWAFRNSQVIGQWCWTTTRGGISLYDGVRPGASGAGDLAGVKDAPAVAGLSEVEWNDYFLRASRQAIVDDPWRIAGLIPVKLARTWSPVLHAPQYGSSVVQLIFAAWYVPLFLLALIGVWALRRDPGTAVGLLLPALCVSLLHAVFVGSVRYRLGAIPMLGVLAACGSGYVWSLLFRETRSE